MTKSCKVKNETKIMYVPLVYFSYKVYAKKPTNAQNYCKLGVIKDNKVLQNGPYKRLFVVYMETQQGKPPGPASIFTGNYKVFRVKQYMRGATDNNMLILLIKKTFFSWFYRRRIKREAQQLMKAFTGKPLICVDLQAINVDPNIPRPGSSKENNESQMLH